MRVELIDRVDRFAELQHAWRDLLGDSDAASPFLTWEWLFSWWTHLAGTRRLAIVTVYDGGDLVAVAPFCARRRMSLFERWELLGTGHAGSDYLDAFVRHGCERNAADALSDYIRDRNVVLRVSHLPSESMLARNRPSALSVDSRFFGNAVDPVSRARVKSDVKQCSWAETIPSGRTPSGNDSMATPRGTT